ncbi:hypothetical protein FACS1894187_07080 [Synergistales bacterium]|nr:hypothetical protein FACS1894187_07080 [Synergistales bacterium]
MPMKNLGTFDGGVVGGGMGIRPQSGSPVRITDAAIANGGAFLISELEKRDPKIREPLTSTTYPRDIPIKTGGGWVEFISSLNIDFGITGGSSSGAVHAPGANTVPVVQANFGRDQFRAHLYASVMRIMFVDMQRQQVTGRSLDQLLTDGIRLNYDKHMDANVYVGIAAYGTTGLLNNPNVTASPVLTGTAGNTAWNTKTPDEVLADVNQAILDGWAASEYDLSAIPNHILLPYEQYNHIAVTKVSPIAEKTILTFLLENNVATKNGGDLFIGATAWNKGAGAGGTDRMVAYVHNDRFIAMEELVPLARTMTQPNIDALSYDSVYMANISEVEVFYTQPIVYYDGI